MALAAVFAVGAAAAGFLAWQAGSDLGRARSDLSSAKAGLDQARTELAAARKETAALSKEMSEQKIVVDQLRAERETARTFLEAEQAIGARLRADLALAKEQLAVLARNRPGGASFPLPVLIRPQPMVIKAAPSQGSAVGNPVAAQPAQR